MPGKPLMRPHTGRPWPPGTGLCLAPNCWKSPGQIPGPRCKKPCSASRCQTIRGCRPGLRASWMHPVTKSGKQSSTGCGPGFPTGGPNTWTGRADNPLIQAPNLKQMWWLLALLTEGYADPETGRVYLGNLRGTTGPDFDREVRENGFRLLHQADALGEENLKDLLGATEPTQLAVSQICPAAAGRADRGPTGARPLAISGAGAFQGTVQICLQ